MRCVLPALGRVKVPKAEGGSQESLRKYLGFSSADALKFTLDFVLHVLCLYNNGVQPTKASTKPAATEGRPSTSSSLIRPPPVEDQVASLRLYKLISLKTLSYDMSCCQV